MAQQEVSLMPARCASCGQVFDLSYDLGPEKEELLVEVIRRAVNLGRRAHLCWRCRK